MNKIDDLIEYVKQELKEWEDFSTGGYIEECVMQNTGIQICKNILERCQQLKANIEEKYVELPCLKCGEKYVFDKRSSHAHGIYEFFCNDQRCRDENLF